MKSFYIGLFFAFALVACGDESDSTYSVVEPVAETETLLSSEDTKSSSAMSSAESSCSRGENASSSLKETSSENAPASSAQKTDSSSEKPESSSAKPESSAEVVSSSSKEVSTSSSAVDSGAGSSAVVPLEYTCELCNNFTASDPELTEKGGKGSITTYGSVTAKETSLGGACNYGQTNIQYYAAIHVNVSPGDDEGPWDGGLACGGCVRVRAATPEGTKMVTVRITDRCPDANCGVDLGGAPASDIMGDLVGRYYGEWEFVSCEGVEGVWGDSTSIWVKEGASAFWSVIQVRNPKDAVKSITARGIASNDAFELKSAIEAENFWTVPQELLQSENEYAITVTYRTGEPDTWIIKPALFAEGEATYYLYDYRK